MKRIIMSAAAIALALVVGATFASGVVDWRAGKIKSIHARGNIIQETRWLPEFDRISVEGTGKVVWKQGPKTEVVVSTHESIMEYIQTDVRSGTLVLSIEDGISINGLRSLEFIVRSPGLKGFSVAGSGSFETDDRPDAGKFDIAISGSGNARVSVDCDLAVVNISGSGDVELSGEADRLEASIAGSGSIKAGEFRVKDAKVAIAGSGDAEIDAEDTLSASIAGSGDIRYRGKPRVSFSGSGSGKLKNIN